MNVELRAIGTVLTSVKTNLSRMHASRRSNDDGQKALVDIILEIETARIEFAPFLRDKSALRRLEIDADVIDALVALRARLGRLIENSAFVHFAGKTKFSVVGMYPGNRPEVEFLIHFLPFGGKGMSALEVMRHVVGWLDQQRLPLPHQEPNSDFEKIRALIPTQKIAPAQFDIRNGRLVLWDTPSGLGPDNLQSVQAAKDELIRQGEKVLERLKGSNCDKSLLENLEDLQEQLVSGQNIIRVALLNATCEMVRCGCSHELNDVTNSMFGAHTRNIDLFVGQFPEWIRFLENAASANLNQDDVAQIREITEGIVRELEAKPEIVDPEVPKTLQKINGLLCHPASSSKRAAFAIIRSIENFVNKVFSFWIDVLEQTAKKTIDSVSTAASKAVAVTLLALALGGASQMGTIAVKVNEMTWLKAASDLIQKQISKIVGE